MRARINKAANVAGLIAHEDHRLASQRGGEKIVRLGQLALVGQVDPAALKDILHL